MRESKMDPKTGRTLYKMSADGLPDLWVEDGHCKRCETYGRCLGFQYMTEDEWLELKHTLDNEEITEAVVAKVKKQHNIDISWFLERVPTE